jgi:hypothetical protein
MSDGNRVAPGRALLDPQAGDRTSDHQLLDLARAFEDRVAHDLGFSGCFTVTLSAPDQGFREACFQSVMLRPEVCRDD